MCFDTVIRFRVRFEGEFIGLKGRGMDADWENFLGNVVGEAEIDYVEGGECGREGR